MSTLVPYPTEYMHGDPIQSRKPRPENDPTTIESCLYISVP